MTKSATPKFRRVTAKQFEKLLTDPAWIFDERLSKATMSKVYRHPDGPLLETSISVGVIYASQNEMDAELERRRQAYATPPQHVLTGRFPYGEDFPSRVPALVDQLAVLLKIPRPELDYSDASLVKVEKKVKHRGRAKSLSEPIFPALVAYVGELMRHQVNGAWQMRLGKVIWREPLPDVWEPWIVDARGQSYNPWLPLYDGLDEDSDYPTIQIVPAVTVEIAFKKHHPPTPKPSSDKRGGAMRFDPPVPKQPDE